MRFDKVPQDMFNEMQTTVKMLFPEGYKNTVLCEDDRKILEIVYN